MTMTDVKLGCPGHALVADKRKPHSIRLGASMELPAHPGHSRAGSRCRIIELPKIPDARGNLTFLEGHRHIPFGIARAYWLYDVPGGQVRGGHAYRQLEEFFVALSGSFDVVVDLGNSPEHFVLNRSYVGLYVPRLVWRHIENFSTNAVCLILASRRFEAADYIRDYDQFVQESREHA